MWGWTENMQKMHSPGNIFRNYTEVADGTIKETQQSDAGWTPFFNKGGIYTRASNKSFTLEEECETDQWLTKSNIYIQNGTNITIPISCTIRKNNNQIICNRVKFIDGSMQTIKPQRVTVAIINSIPIPATKAINSRRQEPELAEDMDHISNLWSCISCGNISNTGDKKKKSSNQQRNQPRKDGTTNPLSNPLSYMDSQLRKWRADSALDITKLYFNQSNLAHSDL